MNVIPAKWHSTQTIALPLENIFCQVTRAGAWRPFDYSVQDNSDGWQSARALGFVCPVCCKVWGIIGTLNATPKGEELEFHTSCCINHLGKSRYSSDRVDGSLLIWYSTPEYGDYDQLLLDALPLELLRREFNVHLAHFEKELAA